MGNMYVVLKIIKEAFKGRFSFDKIKLKIKKSDSEEFYYKR